ncbi:sugar ABC transporter ATP-binding protein [Microbacterium capsulatum]|uniref:Sugar ABC transporter ATP-binding protein n=1 Tax=Microbacterium capsulatum TaxID=3041921 RepID=A0ABU0XCV5_9MICO|nr:sugar ABC transporter ATP-binding protein [Microbacterium sp. ASV81]MDQ4212942.1 sugar ABC transporter ATP-binding protein [Microbacterium sp. ASV81]
MTVPAELQAVEIGVVGVSKAYPGVRALDNVDLQFRPGEIHSIVGENGAGKSTLVRILSGVEHPTSGSVIVDGTVRRLRTPAAARRAGISLVPQEAQLIRTFSVGRNILLGRQHAWVRRATLTGRERAVVAEALVRVGASGIKPEDPASALSAAGNRLCQIAATLIDPGRLLILDEPTAVLADADAEILLERLESLREAGISILYVSHRLSEVIRLSDRITVLRDGRIVGSFARGEADRARILQLMARRQGTSAPARVEAPVDLAAAVQVLSVSGLSCAGAFEGVDFVAREGEVVGIAGIQGSGHGRLLDTIAGAWSADRGTVSVDGRATSGSLWSALRAGIRLVPEDRRERGIVGAQSISENLSIGYGSPGQRQWFRSRAAETARARHAISEFGVRAASAEVPLETLSGGNQQKVVIARVLASGPRVMLLSEPTQGIDVHAKAEILRTLRSIARERRIAVVLASSEFEELIEYADTIHVMRRGRLRVSMPATDATYVDVLEAAVP